VRATAPLPEACAARVGGRHVDCLILTPSGRHLFAVLKSEKRCIMRKVLFSVVLGVVALLGGPAVSSAQPMHGGMRGGGFRPSSQSMFHPSSQSMFRPGFSSMSRMGFQPMSRMGFQPMMGSQPMMGFQPMSRMGSLSMMGFRPMPMPR